MSCEFHPGDRVVSISGGCERIIERIGPNLLDANDPIAFFVGGGSWPTSDLKLVDETQERVPV